MWARPSQGQQLADTGFELDVRGLDIAGIAAMDSLARLASTGGTYATSVRRFVALVQARAARQGVTYTVDDIIPLDPRQPIHEAFVLAFLAEAAGLYATTTIEGTISAVAELVEHRSNDP